MPFCTLPDCRLIFGRKYFQFLAAFTGCLVIFSSEMHFGWSSPALPILTNGSYDFQISHEEASWLAVSIFPGIVLGAILCNFLADPLGRKNVILITTVPLFFSWALLAGAQEDFHLFLGRFLGGIGGGLSFSTVPMYLGEIAEPKIRGLLSSLCPIFVVLGVLYINVIAIHYSLSMSALTASLVPLLAIATFVWMPESPVLLMTKGMKEEARASLHILRGVDEGDKEFTRLSRDLEDAMQDQLDDNNQFLDLFKVPVNRKALLLALGLRSIQQFCGSTAITFYCKSIFQQTDGFISPNAGTITYFTLQAVLATLSSFIVDIVGRRPMFLVSLAGTSLTLFAVGTYMLLDAHSSWDLTSYKSVPIISLLLNVSFFSIGVRNVPLLFISEVFSPKIKSSAMCLATIYYGILAILMTKFYHITSTLIEIAFPMFTFAIFSFISLILYYIYVPETKGKTLEDIQKSFRE